MGAERRGRLLSRGVSSSPPRQRLRTALPERSNLKAIPQGQEQRRYASVERRAWYGTYPDQRLAEGCRSPTRLWRELRRQGFCGQVNSVRYWRRYVQLSAASSEHFAATTGAAGIATPSRLVHAQVHTLR